MKTFDEVANVEKKKAIYNFISVILMILVVWFFGFKAFLIAIAAYVYGQFSVIHIYWNSIKDSYLLKKVKKINK